MQHNSKQVISNQTTIHEHLDLLISKHLTSEYKRPIGAPTKQAFERLRSLNISTDAFILDSGCGIGRSSVTLAQMHPQHTVIGVDKSPVRLQKLGDASLPSNLYLIRADQFDFWRLAAQHRWIFKKHTIFYPNPWPKKKHVQRRVHGHPAFPDLLRISKTLILRSNWKLYVQEFSYAYKLATGRECQIQKILPNPIMSPFEKKFLASGHALYEVEIHNELNGGM